MNGHAPSAASPALIVGGGLAGLYAAYRLAQAHLPCVLWEAQPRWGGRISSLPVGDASGLGVDLGPTWFWPHQSRMQRLCVELGLTRFEQYVAGDVLYQARPDQAPQRSAGAGAMVSYRVEGGMQTLIDALVNRLSPPALKLNHALTSLTRSGDLWTATAQHQGQIVQLQTHQLLIAAPPEKWRCHCALTSPLGCTSNCAPHPPGWHRRPSLWRFTTPPFGAKPAWLGRRSAAWDRWWRFTMPRLPRRQATRCLAFWGCPPKPGANTVRPPWKRLV